ncbi:MAG: hypothetical protein AB4042_01385 [Leptolyngbyaceae cyanobacterium]
MNRFEQQKRAAASDKPLTTWNRVICLRESVYSLLLGLTMPSDIKSPTSTLKLTIDHILGAAIFDLNGLPREYYTTQQYQDISWVQTIFQALGLRSLLMSSLRLEGFNYSVVYGTDYCALVVKQRQCYLAAIVENTVFDQQSAVLIDWMQQIDPSQFRSNEQFTKA